ncbi:hypothetical protein GCM10025867_36390 [Frondihabitans sucicola]|uniref:Periplasmic binding protein/LacI sugar binding domain-containing protein n=1 Tax=Frondihabitans sucicola TaxID=1268041 RepID=A0ABM8GSF7_9MICO|nr:hypothetical protein GCM10025867_36390 [Frondihabitans sucicola]
MAQEAGYSVVLCSTDEDVAREARFLDIAVSENMAGVIIAPASEHSDLEPMARGGRAVVAVDRVSHFDVDGVTMNNREAGRIATEHLVTQGYRRIACITGPADVETAAERAGGWRDALRAATGVDPSDELLRHSTFRVEEDARPCPNCSLSPNLPTPSSRRTISWASAPSRS